MRCKNVICLMILLFAVISCENGLVENNDTTTTTAGTTATTTIVQYREMSVTQFKEASWISSLTAAWITITDTDLDLAELGSIIKSYSSTDIHLDLSKCTELITIADSAFQYCVNLKSITMPAGLMGIGEWAFYECSGLTSVTIGSGVTSIL